MGTAINVTRADPKVPRILITASDIADENEMSA